MRRIAILLLALTCLISGCAGMEVKEVTFSVNFNVNLPGGDKDK